MNKVKKTLIVTSLSAVALAAPIALAQSSATDQSSKQTPPAEWRGQGRHRDDHSGRMHGAIFQGINLTEDQKARMKEIGGSFRESTKSLRQELRAKRQELRQASEGTTFNEALATQKLQEMASLQAKLLAAQFKMRQEMLSVLTPEQKTQLEQKRAEFKAKWAERREHQVQ
jgi:protein CpxP